MQKPLYDALPQLVGGAAKLAKLKGEIPLALLEGVAPQPSPPIAPVAHAGRSLQ